MSDIPSDLPPTPDPYAPTMPTPATDPQPPWANPYVGGVAAPAMVAPPPSMAPSAPAVDSGGGLAVTGLIFSIIAMLGPVFALLVAFGRRPGLAILLLLAAIPLGIIGIVLAVAGRTSVRQRGSASAGLTLGIVALALVVGVVLFALALGRAGGVPGRMRPPRRFVPQQGIVRPAAPAVARTTRTILWV